MAGFGEPGRQRQFMGQNAQFAAPNGHQFVQCQQATGYAYQGQPQVAPGVYGFYPPAQQVPNPPQGPPSQYPQIPEGPAAPQYPQQGGLPMFDQAGRVKIDIDGTLHDNQDILASKDYYEYGRELGRGGFGVVHFASDKACGWRVAVKELLQASLNPRELELYKREIEILLKCDDQFLLKIHGFSISQPLIIVTEFMNGGSLWDLLKSDNFPRLTDSQKTNIALGIAHGMRYLHREGVIHRDLKSPNVLLDRNLRPKVADFGLGKLTEAVVTVPQTDAVGTPQWMAPELLECRPYGFPVDVYAYGMVLFELLTGVLPFEGLQQAEIVRAVGKGERPDIPEKYRNEAIVQLIEACWSQNPEDRPTFKEIYQLFDKGLVSFPESDPRALDMFRSYIQRKDYGYIEDPVWFSLSVLNAEDDGPSKVAEEIKAAIQVGSIHKLPGLLLRLKDGDLNSMELLHHAVTWNQCRMVEFLSLLDVIDVNALNAQGETALMLAVQQDSFFVVKALVDCKRIDLNVQSPGNGDTAFHIACRLGHVSSARILLGCPGADLDIINREGKRARDLTTLPELLNMIEAWRQMHMR